MFKQLLRTLTITVFATIALLLITACDSYSENAAGIFQEHFYSNAYASEDNATSHEDQYEYYYDIYACTDYSGALEETQRSFNEFYFVVIGEALFQIQDENNFISPANIEFVFMGTEPQVREWEQEMGREPATMPIHDPWYDLSCGYVRFVVIDLYDNDNLRFSSLLRRTPYEQLDPALDLVRFFGTWEQVRTSDIIDMEQLHWSLRPSVTDPYFVLFESQFLRGIRAIQDPYDWDFVRPDYVEIEVNKCDNGLYYLYIRMYDEHNTLIYQRVTRLSPYPREMGYDLPYYVRERYGPPIFNVVMVGTLEEIRQEHGGI